MNGRLLLSLIAFCLAAIASPPILAAASPPKAEPQAEYKHEAVRKRTFGKGGTEFCLFEPAKPQPERAPVIVFMHGWMALDPAVYGGWIDHLARQGYIVIYPRYQESALTLPTRYTPNMFASLKDALERMETEDGFVRPNNQKVAAVGHSVGGLLVANYAAQAAQFDLPPARVVFSVQPGVSDKVPLANLKRIPKETILLSIAGDIDKITGTRDARRIFAESTSVPAEHKDFILMRTDRRGFCGLNADHLAPCCWHPDYEKKKIPRGDSQQDDETEVDNGQQISRRSANIDALDTHGFWRLFDDALNAAFNGGKREDVLNNTDRQRGLGKWSDGQAVKEMVVIDRP